MTFDYIPTPRTIPWRPEAGPGSRFAWTIGADGPCIERYWCPPVMTTSSAPDESELEDLLEEVVRRQMVSDVPIGAFLSGGVNSLF